MYTGNNYESNHNEGGNHGELKVVTLEEFRQFKELDKYSDEEALVIIETIKELALIAHEIITSDEQSGTI